MLISTLSLQLTLASMKLIDNFLNIILKIETKCLD